MTTQETKLPEAQFPKENEECMIFRCKCLEAHCMAYEQINETAYFDEKKGEWVGLYALESLRLPGDQKRIERHITVIRRCQHFDRELSRHEEIDYDLGLASRVRVPQRIKQMG